VPLREVPPYPLYPRLLKPLLYPPLYPALARAPGALALALPSPVAVAVAVPVGLPLVKLALASAVPVEVRTEALDELVKPVPVTPLTLVVALA
jgi:hypothetical protein